MGTVGLMIDLIFLLIAAFISFVVYPFWIDFVYKFHMGERVRTDGPATHVKKEGTPTMGGLVFVFSVSIVSFIFNRSRTQTLFPVFIATMAGFLGIVEDFSKVYIKSGLPSFFDYHLGRFFKSNTSIKNGILYKINAGFKEFWRRLGSSGDSGLQTYQKIIVQGIISGFVAYWAYFKLGWDYIWFPLVGDVHLGFLYPIFIFLMFIIVLNSVAFTDGLDGLAGSLSLVVLISFWVLSRILNYNSLAGYCATFVGALIPFLYFNFYPARIFMGNVGSYVLGATLAVLAVVMHREIPFFVMGLVFWIDGFSSPLQQIVFSKTGKRLFRMAPIHHHFELLGWPETKIMLRFMLFGILFAFLGIFVALL